MRDTTRQIGQCIAASMLVVFGLFGVTGCPPGPGGPCECLSNGYDPHIDPGEFVDAVDNPYFPLEPGTTYVYEAETDEGTERTEVVVMEETVEILGVTCTVVRDTVTLEDELIEDTYDWYAQDTEGNVWYFGEATMEYEDGMVRSTFGSWEAGVHCAKPGIVMQADPHVDNTYRQEFYPCVAEDMATIVALGESVTVPYGSFDNCLRIEEFTALDPSVHEDKLYAPGIGHVLTMQDGERLEELVVVVTK